MLLKSPRNSYSMCWKDVFQMLLKWRLLVHSSFNRQLDLFFQSCTFFFFSSSIKWLCWKMETQASASLNHFLFHKSPLTLRVSIALWAACRHGVGTTGAICLHTTETELPFCISLASLLLNLLTSRNYLYLNDFMWFWFVWNDYNVRNHGVWSFKS